MTDETPKPDAGTSPQEPAAEKPTVDLEAEAAAAAADPAEPGHSTPAPSKIEDLPETYRNFVESHTSRAVNEALAADRAKRPVAQPQPAVPNVEQPLTESRFYQLRDAEANGKRLYFKSLSEAGITRGSPEEAKLAETYAKLREQKLVSPVILHTTEGIRFLAGGAQSGRVVSPGGGTDQPVTRSLNPNPKGLEKVPFGDGAESKEIRDRLAAQGIRYD